MTETDRAILRAASLSAPDRVRAADALGISPTRFHQRLTVLIETRAVAEEYPTLVSRLRRVQQGRRRARASRW